MTNDGIQRRVDEVSAHGLPDEGLGDLGSVQSASTKELIREVGEQMVMLARKEVELAKAEMKRDLDTEIEMAKAMGVAGVCGILGLNMLLVAIVFALSPMIYGWLLALVDAIVLLAIGIVFGLVGWARRVKSPLDTTRQTLKEDVQWVKSFRRV